MHMSDLRAGVLELRLGGNGQRSRNDGKLSEDMAATRPRDLVQLRNWEKLYGKMQNTHSHAIQGERDLGPS